MENQEITNTLSFSSSQSSIFSVEDNKINQTRAKLLIAVDNEIKSKRQKLQFSSNKETISPIFKIEFNEIFSSNNNSDIIQPKKFEERRVSRHLSEATNREKHFGDYEIASNLRMINCKERRTPIYIGINSLNKWSQNLCWKSEFNHQKKIRNQNQFQKRQDEF